MGKIERIWISAADLQRAAYGGDLHLRISVQRIRGTNVCHKTIHAAPAYQPR